VSVIETDDVAYVIVVNAEQLPAKNQGLRLRFAGTAHDESYEKLIAYHGYFGDGGPDARCSTIRVPRKNLFAIVTGQGRVTWWPPTNVVVEQIAKCLEVGRPERRPHPIRQVLHTF
jgi:hypothetical protein